MRSHARVLPLLFGLLFAASAPSDAQLRADLTAGDQKVWDMMTVLARIPVPQEMFAEGFGRYASSVDTLVAANILSRGLPNELSVEFLSEDFTLGFVGVVRHQESPVVCTLFYGARADSTEYSGVISCHPSEPKSLRSNPFQEVRAPKWEWKRKSEWEKNLRIARAALRTRYGRA